MICFESGDSTTGCSRRAKWASCGRKPSRWGAHWWSGCATMMGLSPPTSRPVVNCRRPNRWRLRWLPRKSVRACATACWPMLLAGSLGGRRRVGCKVSAAVYFSPLSCQISRYSAAKASKTIPAGDTFRFDAFCRPDSWAENMVQVALKSVPLGQSAGQRILARLSREIPAAVEATMALSDDERQAFSPMLAIHSSQHETQHSRLFRS